MSSRSSNSNDPADPCKVPLPPIPTLSQPTPDIAPQHRSIQGPNGLLTPPSSDHLVDNFTETNALIDSANVSFGNYQGGRNTKFLNTAGNTLSVIQTDVARVQSYASPFQQQAVMDSEPVKAIRQSITALVDGLPALLKVLDDIAQIHPFIKIAVGAFRVAIELDFKRKDNDKKISLLFVEMRDMMAVLVQLQEIDKGKRDGQSGQTIESRMQHLIDKTEEDIRKCANACNAYAKKRLLSKVLQSSSWDDTFQGYVKTFTNRRGEFEFALSLFITRAVNSANNMLLDLDQKMNRVLQYFEACASPEELEIARLVGQRGGPDAVLKDEKALREIYDTRLTATAGMAKSMERRPAGRHADPVDDFTALKQDLKLDPEAAIRDNLEQFERKFVIQQRELEEEMRRTMHREGDRIIQSVTSGPHDRIIDPDIHEIWMEMRWRGSVKARHFVLALRDYFREKFDHLKRAKRGATTPTVASHQISEQDEWTLEYINVIRLQPIIEAFDDDASGFITVAEVNAFTTARPDNWSLLHWLAYWAVGYQMVMSDYAEKTDILLAKMFSIKSQVLPANRTSVEQYLGGVWCLVTELTSGLRRMPMDDTLYGKFESYVKSEEDRLRRNLETVKYDFDAADTVELVRGPGRIEKHLFPLFYLLLKRDFEIMRLGRTRLLHVDELFDATDTVEWVFDEVRVRYTDLSDLFKQQKQDPDKQFKTFAFETFKYWHDNTELWSLKHLRETEFLQVAYDDTLEAQDIDPTTIINYPLQPPGELSITHESDEAEDDQNTDPHVRAILGYWSCFIGTNEKWPHQSMIAFRFHASPTDPKEFQSSGMMANGTSWNCTGKYTLGQDGKAEYKFSIVHANRFWTKYFRGEVQENENVLSGVWAFREDFTGATGYKFLCKRLPAALMCFWPSPYELQENKARALWRFAISATLADVRRRLHMWCFLRERWETGQRYVELIVLAETRQLTEEETKELSQCQRSMTPDEARMFNMLFRDLRNRRVPLHYGVQCDMCGKIIRGVRILCLTCGTKSTIDLCDNPTCRDAEVTRDDLTSPHLPSHDIFKIRTAIHPFREFGPAHRAAQQALKAARDALEDAEELKKPLEQEIDGAQSENAGQLSEPTKMMVADRLRCVKCNEKVSQPCWYCIECEDEVFICSACDEKHHGISSGKHKATHGLVRCQPLAPNADADAERAKLNERMGTLESNLKDMQCKLGERFGHVDDKIDVIQDRLSGKVATVHEQLSGRMSTMDERLARIENLLMVIGRRLGGDREHLRSRQTRHASIFGDLDTGRLGAGEADTPESEFSVWVRELRRSP